MSIPLRSFFLLLLFCCAAGTGNAQHCVFVTKFDEPLTGYAVLTDTTSITSSLPTAHFRPVPDSGIFTNKPGTGTTWLRVCLQNPGPETYHGTLIFSNISARELVFYVTDENGSPKPGPAYRHDGPWPFRGNLPEFPVSVPPGDKKIFHLRARLGGITVPNILQLKERKDFARYNHRWQLADGFVVALGFLYLLATLIFTAINRRPFFVWSAVYALALFQVAFAQAGLGMHLLNWSRSDNDALLLLGSALAALSLPVLFLQYADFPRFQRWMRRWWFVWLTPIVFSLVLFFVPGALSGLLHAAPWLRSFLRVFLFVALFLTVGLGLLVYDTVRRPTLDGGLFLLAYGGFLLPPVLMVLVNNGLYLPAFGPRESFAVAMIVQVVALSGLLLRRARSYYTQSEITARTAADAQRENTFRQAKNQLYANLSHEFRTPLVIIRNLTGRLNGKPEDRRLLLRHNEALLDLVNQLLELDRLDDGRLTLSPQKADLAATTRMLTAEFAPLAEEHNIHLECQTHPALFVADFDERTWRRIVVNLIGNALKFTESHGRVIVRLEGTEQRIRLIVTDTGRGMPPEQCRRVFERFYQSDADHRGSGIGLALVQELVRRLEGDITVESVL